jgi:hypothetical protein
MLRATRFTLGCLLVSVLALALAPAASAQSANDGSVLGVVSDATGAAIPGASVSLHNTQNGNTLTATTDAGLTSPRTRALPGLSSTTRSL